MTVGAITNFIEHPKQFFANKSTGRFQKVVYRASRNEVNLLFSPLTPDPPTRTLAHKSRANPPKGFH